MLETIEVCPLLNSPTGLLLHALQTQHMGACAPYPVGILERGKSDDQLSGCCVAQQLRASHLDSPLKFTRITDDEACISVHLSNPHISNGGSSNLMISHLTHRCHLHYHGHRIHPRPPANHLGPRNPLQRNSFPKNFLFFIHRAQCHLPHDRSLGGVGASIT